MDAQAISRQNAGMNVLHVMAGAKEGGAETAFVDFCIAQHTHGHNVMAACRPAKRNERLKQAGIALTELPFGGVFDFTTRVALRRLIRTAKPDFVVTWMARAAAKMPPRSDQDPPYVRVGRLGGYYKLKYYTGTDHYITLTPDISAWLVGQGVDAARVRDIPNFAEAVSHVTPVTRASLDTPDGAFVFLALSRLHKNKAIDTLLVAASLVPNAYVWIAGAGPDESALKAQAQSLNIQDRVRFLGWRSDRDALLAACDAVVFPSRHEPFGTTFIQAWAAQKPLVTTASQGPSHYVTDKMDALVVPIDVPEALAAAMRTVQTDPFTRERLILNGARRFHETFTKEAILGAWDSFFHAARMGRNV